MEPKLPTPAIERMPSPVNYVQPGEVLPLPPTPETGLGQRTEQYERNAEAASVAAVQSTVVPILPTPITPVLAEDTSQQGVVDDTPLVANDDDLIEKEWVDKAKKIIIETRDDPHRREKEVGKLQADYLLKRYGKELGASQ